MRSTEAIDNRRQQRFEALCPIDDEARSARHAQVITRLLDWKADFYPANPTLAPTAKLERIAVEGICVSRTAYTTWKHAYDRDLNYVNGQCTEYYRLKMVCAREIETAQATGDLDERTYNVLSTLLYKHFLVGKDKLDTLAKYLAVPTYEKLLDQMHCTFHERVENGDVLFQELCDTGTII